MEGLRFLRRVSQIAVWKRVAFFSGAVVEWGQSKMLNKQLLQQKSTPAQEKIAVSEATDDDAAMFRSS